MYSFFKNMWILKEVDESRLGKAVTKGYITEEEKQEILEIPRRG